MLESASISAFYTVATHEQHGTGSEICSDIVGVIHADIGTVAVVICLLAISARFVSGLSVIAEPRNSSSLNACLLKLKVSGCSIPHAMFDIVIGKCFSNFEYIDFPATVLQMPLGDRIIKVAFQRIMVQDV